MEAQKLSEGVLKRASYGDDVWFDVQCTCGSKDHYHDVMVEVDRESNLVTVLIYTESHTPLLGSSDSNPVRAFFREIAHRITVASQVLFRGHYKYENDIVMTRQQALNYGTALVNAFDNTENNNNGGTS